MCIYGCLGAMCETNTSKIRSIDPCQRVEMKKKVRKEFAGCFGTQNQIKRRLFAYNIHVAFDIFHCLICAVPIYMQRMPLSKGLKLWAVQSTALESYVCCALTILGTYNQMHNEKEKKKDKRELYSPRAPFIWLE